MVVAVAGFACRSSQTSAQKCSFYAQSYSSVYGRIKPKTTEPLAGFMRQCDRLQADDYEQNRSVCNENITTNWDKSDAKCSYSCSTAYEPARPGKTRFVQESVELSTLEQLVCPSRIWSSLLRLFPMMKIYKTRTRRVSLRGPIMTN